MGSNPTRTAFCAFCIPLLTPAPAQPPDEADAGLARQLSSVPSLVNAFNDFSWDSTEVELTFTAGTDAPDDGDDEDEDENQDDDDQD